ncbi:alpha-galactosidase, partial [Parabacteroides distasonis]|nr:alpha-galactosidase [Parabacteroides distasonis]
GGELLFGGEVTLAGPGEGQNSYDTPWLFGSYGDGLNEIAARFHSYVRSLHPRLFSHGRPVILNTWEAVYFDHNFDTLKALADKGRPSRGKPRDHQVAGELPLLRYDSRLPRR